MLLNAKWQTERFLKKNLYIIIGEAKYEIYLVENLRIHYHIFTVHLLICFYYFIRS